MGWVDRTICRSVYSFPLKEKTRRIFKLIKNTGRTYIIWLSVIPSNLHVLVWFLRNTPEDLLTSSNVLKVEKIDTFTKTKITSSMLSNYKILQWQFINRKKKVIEYLERSHESSILVDVWRRSLLRLQLTGEMPNVF